MEKVVGEVEIHGIWALHSYLSSTLYLSPIHYDTISHTNITSKKINDANVRTTI